MERRLDVIIFGATGFTGRLVAEYLVEHHGRELRLAIAGRNAAKLEQLKDELLRERGGLALEVRVADSADHDAMLELARETRVVCTTVGPYAKFGSALVDACAQSQEIVPMSRISTERTETPHSAVLRPISSRSC